MKLFQTIQFSLSRSISFAIHCDGARPCVYGGRCPRVSDPREVMKKCAAARRIGAALAACNHAEFDFGFRPKIFGDAIREDLERGTDRIYLMADRSVLSVDFWGACDRCASRPCRNYLRRGELKKYCPDDVCAKVAAFLDSVAACR